MILSRDLIENDMRYLLIDLFAPYIKSSDFLTEEYDEAIKGISYRPDTGHRINYDYSRLIHLIQQYTNSKNPIQELSIIMKDKPVTEASTDFKEFPEDKKDKKETDEQLFLNADMEKLASEALNPSADCADGKSFISEEE